MRARSAPISHGEPSATTMSCAPHVRGDQPVALGRVLEQVLVEATGREVAVDEDDRDPVLRAGLVHLKRESVRLHARGAHGASV
jgi:hypothetical protein